MEHRRRERAPGLRELGMVTDMAWADLDRDGDPDMVITGEWMPVTVFLNRDGRFENATEEWGLQGTEGWWQRVAVADLDGNGYPDLLAGNLGLNSRFHASADKPVRLYTNDFDLNGSVEHILTTYRGDSSWPLVMKDDLVKQIPGLGNRYPTFQLYSGSRVEDLFAPDILKRSVVREARWMESTVFYNDAMGHFIPEILPKEAQLFPVYALLPGDWNGDGRMDLWIGGNLSRAKPETGSYLAGYGLYLQADKTQGLVALPSDSSGVWIPGEIRDLVPIRLDGKPHVAVARNNAPLLFYTHTETR
ncbi:MAG: VCBS repeat-containing protein [Bacteroidales bacterium]